VDDVGKMMVTTCDVCGTVDGVQAYCVGKGRRAPCGVDLCEEHARPLEELLTLGSRLTAGATPLVGATIRTEMQEPKLRTEVLTQEAIDKIVEQDRARAKK
jgi:hypothetical protein